MIEKEKQEKYFPTLDGTKKLTLKQINSDFLKYLRENDDPKLCRENQERLNMVARLFLIRKGYLAGGEQPNGSSREIFDSLVENIKSMQPSLTDMPSEKPISVFSKKEQKNMLMGACRLKKEEEDRAGQTYQEMDLEL